jgi:hypothetical protein
VSGSGPLGSRPFFLPLFTQVPSRDVLRTSQVKSSTKFRRNLETSHSPTPIDQGPRRDLTPETHPRPSVYASTVPEQRALGRDRACGIGVGQGGGPEPSRLKAPTL